MAVQVLNYVDIEVDTISRGPPTDITSPTIHSFDPAPGTPIEANTPIAFTVTDNVALRRAAVYVMQKDRKLVLHDGDGFSAEFESYSTRVPTTGGFRFTARRNSGWLSTPIFSVSAIDTSGNEAV